jgi:hypothetical protein
MADGRVPVFRAIRLAYSDVFRVVRAMPRLVGMVTAILLAFTAVQTVVPQSTLEYPPLAFALSVVSAFLLASYLIAVHRFILIDEATQDYALAPQEPRFLRFFGWWVALSAIPICATLARNFLMLLGLPNGVALIGTAIITFVGVFIGARLIILFPAVAVEAPGAGASNAFADTKGYFWNIFFIVFPAMLPLIVLVALWVFLSRLSPSGATSALSTKALDVIFLTIFALVAYTLYIAIASRLFQALAERLMGRAAV